MGILETMAVFMFFGLALGFIFEAISDLFYELKESVFYESKQYLITFLDLLVILLATILTIGILALVSTF